MGWGGTGATFKLALVFKKNHKSVSNPFIKIEPHPIRGGVGRVPEKILPHPIVIPIAICQA